MQKNSIKVKKPVCRKILYAKTMQKTRIMENAEIVEKLECRMHTVQMFKNAKNTEVQNFI